MSETVQAVCRRLGVVRPELTILCRELGIDPDMPIETLKRRVLWGERVERATDVLDGPGLNNAYRDAQRDLIGWLTTPEASVSSCQTCGDKRVVPAHCSRCGHWLERVRRCPACCGGTGEETP